MDITAASLDILFRTVDNTFQQALQDTPVIYPEIAITIPMGSRQTTQAFLDRVPQMRKWIGNRVLNNALARSRTITAELYEDTLEVDKYDLKDELMPLFSQSVQMLGEAGKKWPDKLVADFIKTATTVNGYDGVPVFSTVHPILGGVAGGVPAGAPATQSNLLVSSALTLPNYITARQNMRQWVGADGAPMTAEPNILMVPPQLEGTAKQIIESAFLPAGPLTSTSNASQTNVWQNSVKVLVNPWINETAWQTNWWLLDTRSAVKPFAFYQLDPVTMTALTNPSDPNVFMNHKFVWGIESRGTACETVWWLAYAGTANATYIP